MRALAVLAAFALAAPVHAAPAGGHRFTMTAIDGKPLPLARFDGRVMLVVNTASMCGFTPQYTALQALQTGYAKRGFTVVGVPSNDFEQELSSNAKIKQFCESKFGINFPMSEASAVTGAKAVPFYRWARATMGEANAPKWNFHKYLVGRDGRLLAAFGSKTAPDAPEVKRAIEAALAARG